MKYAILGDIHANLEALEAILDDAHKQGAERYACTGDIVGYNADPKACLQQVRQIGCTVVQGNHDYYAACNEPAEFFTPIAQRSIRWTRRQLSPFDRRYLRHLPLIADVDDFTIVHSSLNHPHRWSYILRPRLAEESFRNQFRALCFYGHTHCPTTFIKFADGAIEQSYQDSITIEPNRHYLVNVGSVGQPRDRNPLAAYTLYDSEAHSIKHRRVPYDIATAQRKVRAAGLPFRNALRLAGGR